MTKYFFVLLFYIFLPVHEASASPLLLITPKEVFQGEPVMIQVHDAKIADIQNIKFDGKNLNVFSYQNKPTALLGIDLNKKIGAYTISLLLKDGSATTSLLIVKEREKYQTYLAVPEKLGGNSTTSQIKVVNTLAIENASIAHIKTFARALWTKKFIYPLSGTLTTIDPYGFSRTSGAASIAHKGTDFRAPLGTKIVAMNRGIVRVAKKFTVYGNMVVVDHGLGVSSFYIHLSKIKVNVGELVQQGQVIGLSGSTGYATGPHLHLSLRINNISIDPVKFLDLFK